MTRGLLELISDIVLRLVERVRDGLVIANRFRELSMSALKRVDLLEHAILLFSQL